MKNPVNYLHLNLKGCWVCFLPVLIKRKGGVVVSVFIVAVFVCLCVCVTVLAKGIYHKKKYFKGELQSLLGK